MRILICYASFSGNTKETAELIEEFFSRQGWDTDLHRIGGAAALPDPAGYDAMLLGSFTWAKGATPPIVKDFVYELGYKPPAVFVFGTGDTQFGGDELFCHAAEKLARFYHSPAPPLKIEQSPRGQQEKIVRDWAEGVHAYVRNINARESIGARQS